MTSEEARQILLLYRGGREDDSGPEMLAALEQMRRDPELEAWFEQHSAFQRVLREKMQNIPVPADFKERLLAGKVARAPLIWWQKTALWPAAAAIILLLSLAGFWLKPKAPDRFANFRERMVRTVLREYRMDILTNDLAVVRLFLSTNGAPADYVLPKALEQTPLVGAGRLSWQGQPVSLICFERPPTNMLFLFVANRAALPGGASTTPQFVRINKLMTASWTRGNNLYLLAGAGDESGLLPYLE